MKMQLIMLWFQKYKVDKAFTGFYYARHIHFQKNFDMSTLVRKRQLNENKNDLKAKSSTKKSNKGQKTTLTSRFSATD